MNILIAIIICILVFFLVFIQIVKRKNIKQIMNLKKEWGKSNTKYRNFDWIKNFSDINKDSFFHKLSSQTLNDVDFNELFAYIDRTTSKPGQQYLYYTLLRPTDNLKALLEFDEKIQFFLQNEKDREDIQLILLHLRDPDAYYISSLLEENIYEKPAWAVWLKFDSIIVISMLILCIKFSVLIVWLIIPFTINTILHLWNKSNTIKFIKSLTQLNILINVVKKIDVIYKTSTEISIESDLLKLQKFQRKFKSLGNNSSNILSDVEQIVLFLWESVKALFLVEVYSFMNCMDELKNKKEVIGRLYEYVGKIDMAISTASLRKENNGNFCKPHFIIDEKEIRILNIHHPLIKNCVTNSINVRNESILITGSNMSGKTTFIRTVAINSILAQTIYTTFAETFVTPILKVMTSIRISDNLIEGKSYFFEELNSIQYLINQSETSFQHLFILDEIFKGTNTVERIAAAKAVLTFLNKKGNFVLVSTHDLELSEILKINYKLYHFEEEIVGETLSFDYKIKEGKLRTTNAIRLLEMVGYPSKIIIDAKEYLKEQFVIKYK